MRNKKVSSAMKAKFSNGATSQISSSISCISNIAYNRHKDGYDGDDIPIPIFDTGVPALRRELLALPAASRLNVLKAHVVGVLPTLLDTLMCWSSASIIKKREELRVIVAKPRQVRMGAE